MVNPVRKSVVDNPDFQKKMEGNKDFLQTFNTIIDHTGVLFTPQSAFFDATTLWAGAPRKSTAAPRQPTLDQVVEQISEQFE